MDEQAPVPPRRRWALAFFGVFGLMLAISALAYLDLLPGELNEIPFSDTIGHFALFGLAAYLADRALGRRRVHALGWALALGPLAVAGFAVVDELLQLLSPVREFDLVDLAAGLSGVLLAGLLSGVARGCSSRP